MAGLLVPSLETIRRTVAIELAYTMKRLGVLERMPGNPVGVGFRPLGDGAVALRAKHLPVPSFNSIVGLRAGHEGRIDELLAWYAEAGAKPNMPMVPALFTPEIGRALARHGFEPRSFHSSLIGASVPPAPPLPPNTTIDVVSSADLMEAFLDAYVAGWEIGAALHEQFKANVRPWRHEPGWTLYVARRNGEPAASAILYVADRAGYLADASTAPAHRRHGLQSALLARRIADAHAANVDFCCSGANYLSQSERNMLRAGLQLQFVRTIWSRD